MTNADMIAFTDVACEAIPDRKEKPKVRRATQADIDMLLG